MNHIIDVDKLTETFGIPWRHPVEAIYEPEELEVHCERDPEEEDEIFIDLKSVYNFVLGEKGKNKSAVLSIIDNLPRKVLIMFETI